MLKLQADYIFPINQPPIKNGILVLQPDGTIAEIVSAGVYAPAELTKYEGILCPGFVNAHCHTELSHLKGAIPSGGGLLEFLKPIGQLRNEYSLQTIHSAITEAQHEMLQNGIVAVGDIANDNLSFAHKTQNKLHYHTLVEIFGLNPARAQASLELGRSVFEQAPATQYHRRSLAPHAPYSISGILLQQIEAFNAENGGIISIHNQETEDEDVFFRLGAGSFPAFYESLGLGNVFNYFTPPGTTSLQYVLANLSGRCKLLLVHNTFTTAADIGYAHQNYPADIYWCFCPNANLYIENKLPDFDAFISQNAKIVVGTDSLASNWQLSILAELKTITQHAPHIPLTNLLTWATLNGAFILGFEQQLGSFEVGKKPGVVWIENLNTDTLQLTPNSTCQRVG